jgi:hypothetical protein
MVFHLFAFCDLAIDGRDVEFRDDLRPEIEFIREPCECFQCNLVPGDRFAYRLEGYLDEELE